MTKLDRKRYFAQATTHPDLGTQRAGQGSSGDGQARADARQHIYREAFIHAMSRDGCLDVVKNAF